MDLENIVMVVEIKDAIYMGLLQVAMLITVFFCGFYFGSLRIDHESCVDNTDETIDDGSTFGPSKIVD